MTKIATPDGIREMTAQEQANYDARQKRYADQSASIKLNQIRFFMANSDVTMPSYIKTWRQTLRDLPQNNTTESQYDALLERNADGTLKNSVWTQPTE